MIPLTIDFVTRSLGSVVVRISIHNDRKVSANFSSLDAPMSPQNTQMKLKTPWPTTDLEICMILGSPLLKCSLVKCGSNFPLQPHVLKDVSHIGH